MPLLVQFGPIPTNPAEWNRFFRGLTVTPDTETVTTESIVDDAVTPAKLSEAYYTETELDGGQLDTQYYTETELDAGQLNTLYYTETELDAGQLDTRYYTETEVNTLLAAKTATGTFTGTLTGCTTTPTDTIRYDRSHDLITLYIPQINATSNTTAMTITGGSAAMYPTRAQRVPFTIQDSGTEQLGIIEVGTDGVLTSYSDVAGAAFTGSGTKGVELQTITYSIK